MCFGCCSHDNLLTVSYERRPLAVTVTTILLPALNMELLTPKHSSSYLLYEFSSFLLKCILYTYFFQQYSPLLKAFTSQGVSELTLLLKIQEYCYDNIHFMKAFQKIVVLLYKGKLYVLSLCHPFPALWYFSKWFWLCSFASILLFG